MAFSRVAVLMRHLSKPEEMDNNALKKQSCGGSPKPNKRMPAPANKVELNWAGNIAYRSKRILTPTSVQEVQTILRNSAPGVRVLGSRHSFNRIADTTKTMISLERMCRVLSIESDAVTVEGGITYGQLCPQLHQRGFALHNLASLPHISIAGAISTGTHGSGLRNGNLSTAVRALTLVNGTGELVHVDRSTPALFSAAVVGMGCFGVIVAVTLDIQPRFDVSQTVYGPMPLSTLARNFLDVMGSEYSVSAFTPWFPASCEIWCKRRLGDGDLQPWAQHIHGARQMRTKRHPVSSMDVTACTEQLGEPGRWYDRLPHFRFEFTPSAGEEIQSEFFVPIETAADAIAALTAIGPDIVQTLWVSELRCIAADDILLSPAYARTSLALHFTWKDDWAAVRRALSLVETALRPFRPRPHMGKVFTMSPVSVRRNLDPKALSAFQQQMNSFDPEGVFQNDWTTAFLSGSTVDTPGCSDAEWSAGTRLDDLMN